jgi:aminoglycoside/choline kinase family phosphotransferase
MSSSTIADIDLERFVRVAAALPESARLSIEPLAGDVSLRRYFRARGGGERAIVAFYPPELRDAARRFERTTALLERASVRVPQIRGLDHDRGLMLLEDVGEEVLFDRRERGWLALEPYLATAHDAMLRIRSIDPADLDPGLLAPLDAAVLERELGMTWDVFLAPAGLVEDAVLARRLRQAFAALCAALEAGGLAPCHRDFMARNLVPLAGSAVAVLDHQDLRLGPVEYAAASLFNDSLYPARAEVESIAGTALPASAGFHRAAAQRTLKIVGTFASFAQRGHPRHLPLIPISLRRALEHLAALPETAALAADLETSWASSLC